MNNKQCLLCKEEGLLMLREFHGMADIYGCMDHGDDIFKLIIKDYPDEQSKIAHEIVRNLAPEDIKEDIFEPFTKKMN